jgi:hypothetical protein
MPHKLYIDSRARVNPGGSTHSNFVFQLKSPIDLPHARCFVDQVHLPNIFSTITLHNRYIYVEELVAGVSTKRKLALTEGLYDANTLPTHLASILNTGTTMAANSYTVTYSNLTGRLTVATSDIHTFYIWTRQTLEEGLWNPGGSAALTYSVFEDAYDVLGFNGLTNMIGTSGDPAVGSGAINVIPYHTLYIHSGIGSQNDSIGPSGGNRIIRTVCLDQPPGRYVHDRSSSPFDYVSVAKGQLQQIDIKLTDWLGRPVPLTDSWSFSFILVGVDEM